MQDVTCVIRVEEETKKPGNKRRVDGLYRRADGDSGGKEIGAGVGALLLRHIKET